MARHILVLECACLVPPRPLGELAREGSSLRPEEAGSAYHTTLLGCLSEALMCRARAAQDIGLAAR
jgi:hypothetical protein